MFTIIHPDGALRPKHIKKVKSTYDHLCGLLVQRSNQRTGNEGKRFSSSQTKERLKR